LIKPKAIREVFENVYLGPEFTNEQILEEIKRNLSMGYNFNYVKSPYELAAKLIYEKKVIEQGGVRLDGKVIRDVDYSVSTKDGQIIRIEKRCFRRLKFEK